MPKYIKLPSDSLKSDYLGIKHTWHNYEEDEGLINFYDPVKVVIIMESYLQVVIRARILADHFIPAVMGYRFEEEFYKHNRCDVSSYCERARRTASRSVEVWCCCSSWSEANVWRTIDRWSNISFEAMQGIFLTLTLKGLNFVATHNNII